MPPPTIATFRTIEGQRKDSLKPGRRDKLCPFNVHLLLLALTEIGLNGHNDIKDELFPQAINALRLESTPILMLIGVEACGGANRLNHAV